jgi:ribitol 2-dehydrogenase
MTNVLEGQIAVVTGASQGIGLTITEALIEHGVKVVAISTTEAKLHKAFDRYGDNVVQMPLDLLNDEACDNLVPDVLKKVSQIDIFIPNAGYYIGGDLTTNSKAEIRRAAKLNYEVVVSNVHGVLPHMVERQKGDIIVVTSLAGHYPTPWEPVYASSKRAASEFVHITRQQYCEQGIRIAEVAPGPVETPLTERWDQNMLAKARENKAILDTREVADAVMYIATRPRTQTVRDIVMMPTKFKL